jgi:hypothetical protein
MFANVWPNFDRSILTVVFNRIAWCCREQEEREERDRLRREGKPLPPELARSSSDDYHNGGDRGGRGDRGDRGGGFGGGWPPGSHDDSDPFSTNLYVGNIHPEVGLSCRFKSTSLIEIVFRLQFGQQMQGTWHSPCRTHVCMPYMVCSSTALDTLSVSLFQVNEAHLAREFGRFGPIGSVKIMWPRDEEQRRRGRNCGFVAFMVCIRLGMSSQCCNCSVARLLLGLGVKTHQGQSTDLVRHDAKAPFARCSASCHSLFIC